jgi:methionyl-tRNA formyltransferase
LVNGLTEAQAWYLGWLRDGTQSHEMLAVIDHFEVQTRRKNEVAPPPVCSMELPQLKAVLEAVTLNRETVVRSLAWI